MTLRRRDLLKSSALAAGAAMLDACGRKGPFARLRQPVTPPEAPAGASLWKPSVCQECAAGCGILVRTVDGDAKKLEGNREHPVNRGGLCALGQASLQGLYDPDRITAPLRRTGERGSGAFEEISWDVALREVAEAVARLRDTDPVRLGVVLGDSSSALLPALWRRFASAVGAPPPVVLEAPGAAVERAAAARVFGFADLPAYDIAAADLLVSFGSPFLDRWRSPVHHARALTELRQGLRQGREGRRGRFVQVEARLSLTAAAADDWLAPRPGSEGTLALAVAAELLADGRQRGEGERIFRALFPAPLPSLEAAAQACGLAADRIAELAARLAAVERPLVIAGGSAGGHRNGLANLVAALALNHLVGSVGRRGGVLPPVSFGLGAAVEPPPRPAHSIRELARRLRRESGPPVDLLLLSEADLVYSWPAGGRIEQAIRGVGKIVSLTQSLDETARLADLVLPLHHGLERLEAVEPRPSVGVRTLGLKTPVIVPLGDTRHPGDFLLALARALGGRVAQSLPWPSYGNLLEERVRELLPKLPGGADADFWTYYEEAQQRGGIWDEGPPQGVRVPPPSKLAPVEVGGEGEEGAAYPFHLLPFETVALADGGMANRPWLQELPDPLTSVMWGAWVELAPRDAERLGVATGDALRLTSKTGTFEAPAFIHPAVRPGTVGVPFGQGYSRLGRWAQGRGANPLALVDDLAVDGTEAPAWAAARVRVERLERLSPGRLTLFGPGLEEHEEVLGRERPRGGERTDHEEGIP